nr:FERM, ARHGEF and pleckstrin domain-containing protein 1 isoform X3 [Parasteatoda tepidariorum]XP_042908587.1 FERM, ARHGEF and pleckstrin domain-containing protein 1 isoform X4 [Parasteatoda tepidariorum]
MTSKLSKSSDLYEPSHRRSKKFMNITVFFLDDSSHVFQLQYWLDVLKPLCSQLHSFFPSMYFCVKFYTPDPVQLEDEFTRYLFGLQIKKDFISGALQCNDSTAAVLLSYIVQADLGDFNPEVCIDHSYLTKYKFVAYQDEELEKKIMENHRKIIGQTPAEADLNLLERARRCELYRVRMTFDKDHEGVPLNLAVVHLGVLVFQNFTKINTFSWAKIRKLSFKRKKFLVKLHPEGYGFYKDTVEFVFDSRNECKNFWKKCIENHTFFRCSDAKQGMRMKPKIFSRGSSFRYSGRTQKQVSEFVRQNNFQKTQFQRSTSCRTPTSPTKSISSSIVPQPLLPVTSSSCGSMSDVPKDVLLPPKSTSEPTTPHTAPDFGKISNGSANVSGVVSPESDLAGFQSPEFCMQDTDDNISHDSYHVLDTNQAAAATNTDNPSTNKEIETVSDFKEDDGNSVGEIKDNSALNPVAYNNNLESVKADNNNTESIETLKIDSKTNDLNILESSPTDSLDLSSQDMNNLKQILLSQEQDGISLSSSDNLSYNENILSQELKNYKNVLSDSYFRESSKNSSNEETLNNSKNSEHVFGASTFYVSSSPYSAGRLSSKRKVMNDRAYCLAKELLMTERTYRKDLEVVNVTFRDNYYSQKDVRSEAIEQFLSVVDPLHEMHCFLLRDLEQRLAFWEGRPVNKNQNVIKGVANILYAQKDMIKMHSTYLKKLPKLLEMLYDDLSQNQLLNQFYQQFETQKVCYLPLSSFLLRPAFRLVYYHSLVKS